jgi:hypothetical protein
MEQAQRAARIPEPNCLHSDGASDEDQRVKMIKGSERETADDLHIVATETGKCVDLKGDGTSNTA